MRAVTLLGLALLAACAPAPKAGFRGTGPIYSNAVFQPQRLEGRWVQVADFAPAGAAPCTATGLAVNGAGPLVLRADLCLGGVRRSFDGQAVLTGPGRITLTGADQAGIGAEWWVLWVDDGYRTMVVGTPSGAFGMILDRSGTVPPDRMAAAREILDWNGYDLRRLRPVPQG